MRPTVVAVTLVDERSFERVGDDLPSPRKSRHTSAVELLGRIQERTGQWFPITAELDEADVKAIELADALLRGEPVSGHWSGATVVLDEDSLTSMRSATADLGALFEFTSDYTVEVAGHRILLGPAHHRLFQVHLTDARPGPAPGLVEARLRAGRDDHFEVHLLPAGGSGAAVAGHGLDQYAGQWIAQAGEEVVASGSTPREVAAELRRTGRQGAIWRVPLTGEEAEATFGP
jgi:hypothetical protein